MDGFSKVMEYFYEISKIPRGSGNTGKIADFLVDFAEKRNLKYSRDAYNNVIIIKDAGFGFENAPAIIIQGHTDMVCEKESGTVIDMQNEGLKLKMSDGFLYADGTTLGADDGIFVSYALALLDDTKNAYPKIEAVFTVDEEIGMLGADLIDLSGLEGKWLLNIDSEAEGVFTVGCAGGVRADCKFNLQKTKNTKNTYKISVCNLTGGHSGIEIGKFGANANKILGRILCSLEDFNILDISGGSKDNVIPSSGYVKICSDVCNIDKISEILKNEFSKTDPDMEITVEETEKSDYCYDSESTEKIVFLLMAFPNGVRSFYDNHKGLVKTSLNMGILNISDDVLNIGFCIRSAVLSEKNMLCDEIKLITEYAGGIFSKSGEYCGWEYKENSKLCDSLLKLYKKLYKREAVTDVIHAGLECGILSQKIKGLDCVSFGPDILDIHTVDERLDIESAKRVWNLIREFLSEMK